MRESINSRANYLTKCSFDLNGMWYTVESCWCNESHTHFVHTICKGENAIYVILLRKKERRLVFRHLQRNFFQIWYDNRDIKALHFDTSWDDLDIHSRSQLYDKSTTLVSPFLCKLKH